MGSNHIFLIRNGKQSIFQKRQNEVNVETMYKLKPYFIDLESISCYEPTEISCLLDLSPSALQMTGSISEQFVFFSLHFKTNLETEYNS